MSQVRWIPIGFKIHMVELTTAWAESRIGVLYWQSGNSIHYPRAIRIQTVDLAYTELRICFGSLHKSD